MNQHFSLQYSDLNRNHPRFQVPQGHHRRFFEKDWMKCPLDAVLQTFATYMEGLGYVLLFRNVPKIFWITIYLCLYLCIYIFFHICQTKASIQHWSWLLECPSLAADWGGVRFWFACVPYLKVFGKYGCGVVYVNFFLQLDRIHWMTYQNSGHVMNVDCMNERWDVASSFSAGLPSKRSPWKDHWKMTPLIW